MGRLIIVAGAGGAGKSFFLRCWAKLDNKSVRIKKFVSSGRQPREIEIKTGESDLIFSQEYNPETKEGRDWMKQTYPHLKGQVKRGLEYHKKNYSARDNNKYNVYMYQQAYYEVDVDAIDKALNEGKNPIVIIRKCETIKKIMQRYGNALVIYVQSILSGDDLIKKLVLLGESEQDARKRQSRNAEDLKDYISSIHTLPSNVRVVVNDFDENESSAVFTQINDIYIEEIINYTLEEKSIFLIQSYKNMDEVDSYGDDIRTAAENVFGRGAKVQQAIQRRDGAYMISDNVWKTIDSSDCIICDITCDRCCDCDKMDGNVPRYAKQGVSSNVFLELGYAINQIRNRGIDVEKRLIITEKVQPGKIKTQIPVDLGGTNLSVLYYKDRLELINGINERLRNMFIRRCD